MTSTTVGAGFVAGCILARNPVPNKAGFSAAIDLLFIRRETPGYVFFCYTFLDD